MDFAARKDFLFALSRDFSLATFTAMLLSQLDRRLENEVAPTPGQTFPDVLDIVVQKAIQEGWIWYLIDGAFAVNPNGAGLRAFVAKHPDLDPAKVPPRHSDHKELREALKEMWSPEGSRVLIVTGNRGSGVSYTGELIKYRSDGMPDQKVIFVDFDLYPFDSLSLTENIGQQMGMDISTIPRQFDEPKMRWTSRLSDWITAKILNSGDITYWFIFDGFRVQPLLAETRDLIEALALRAESAVPQCRIVLLGYSEVLPIQINDYVRRVHLTSIGKDE